MDVFYHVDYIKRKKKCKFGFSLQKSEKVNIYGEALVDLRAPERKVIFDADSELALNSDEKSFIISRVIRHIKVGVE